MTYLAKPKLHHPTCRRTRSASRAATTRARSRRCAPAAGTTRSARRSSRRAGSSTIQPHRVAKLSGIGCSSKTPDLLPRPVPRLQHRARAHALGAHGRQPRQPRPDLPRRLGRRRLGLHRPGPVRPRHAPRREHDLHRREQRRLRPHQGPVLRHRRPRLEGASAARSTPTRRIDLVLLALQLGATYVARSFSGDKDAARAAHQGRAHARGRRLHRRHLALRRVQQPRRLAPRATTTCASTTRR